mmetsp:Transcript_17832/g.38905  ORF Transcript_17832/g.38905 Transcript_17832/m.38905 type:complete len:268 (-) Transcript_17832:1179-1982(-)
MPALAVAGILAQLQALVVPAHVEVVEDDLEERPIGVGEEGDVVQPDEEVRDVGHADEEPVEHKVHREEADKEDQPQHKVRDDGGEKDGYRLHDVQVRRHDGNKADVPVEVRVQLWDPERQRHTQDGQHQAQWNLDERIDEHVLPEGVAPVGDLLHDEELLEGEGGQRHHGHVAEEGHHPDDGEHAVHHVPLVVRQLVVGDAEEAGHEGVEHEAEGVHRRIPDVEPQGARRQRQRAGGHEPTAPVAPLLRALRSGRRQLVAAAGRPFV